MSTEIKTAKQILNETYGFDTEDYTDTELNEMFKLFAIITDHN